jgi:putative heme-binding domain-containing protein
MPGTQRVAGRGRRAAAALAVVLAGAAARAGEPPHAYEAHALTHAGDVDAGRKLFFEDRRTACPACHVAGGRGRAVGPDLSHVGGKLDRPHLIESVLEPSKQVVEGYRTTVIETDDGATLSGVLTARGEKQVTLSDAAAAHVVPRSRIRRTRESPASLMPQGLASGLTPAAFTDLVAYLESLRPPGAAPFGAGVVGPIVLPGGFGVRTVATGLTGATAMEVAADGRVFVCEQVGRLRVVKDGRLLERPFASLPVEAYWERGLVGVTVHPEFPRTPFVYVCYVAKGPYPHHVVSRLTADGDAAVPGSEKVLLSGDDQRGLGGNVPAGHQGGALHFGRDGRLYAALGEQTAGAPSQRLDSLLGKILRLEPDGSIPPDNPFVAETTGKYRAVWALGLRNPYTFAVDGTTGDMLINDVGGRFEEINRGAAGANYGWPTADHGPTAAARITGPVHHYPQGSIAGGDFAPAGGRWPAHYRGRYFFADFVQGWVKTLDPREPTEATTFATGLRRPSDLRFAPDGSLYVLLRNAWVMDEKFEPATGTLLRINAAGER